MLMCIGPGLNTGLLSPESCETNIGGTKCLIPPSPTKQTGPNYIINYNCPSTIGIHVIFFRNAISQNCTVPKIEPQPPQGERIYIHFSCFKPKTFRSQVMEL